MQIVPADVWYTPRLPQKAIWHDDFVTGILSKQKGQACHVAAMMKAMFSLDCNDTVETLLNEDAVKAAIDFIQVCCNHVI